MLLRIVDKYNQDSNSAYVFELTEARDVKHQTVQGKLYTMNITLRATRYKDGTNEQELSNLNETLKHCEVRVWQKAWIKSESINITNCWTSVRQLQPINSRWSPQTLKDLKQNGVSFLVAERVRLPNNMLSVDRELVVDQVENPYLVEVNSKKMYMFDVYLKDAENSSQTFMCKVIQPSGDEFHNQAAIIYDCNSKHTEKGPDLFGSPKILDESEMHSVEFQEMMEHVTDIYNRNQNDLYYYAYGGVKNASKQLVSGTKTIAFVYLERTVCRKVEHEYLLRSKRYSLCATGTDMHQRAKICEIHILEKLSDSPPDVRIMECKVIAPSELDSVNPVVQELQHTSTYRNVVNLATLVYNLYSDHPVLYQVHQVENFKRTDKVKSEYEFDLVMWPTKCLKWNEALLYFNKHYNMCTKTAMLNVVTCKAKVGLLHRFPSVELDKCEHIHVHPIEYPRPMSQKETLDPEFQKLVDMSVKLFNSRIRSSFWYELVHVENPMVGYSAGRYQKFDLHMVSTKCRLREDEGTVPETKEKNCSAVDRKFMVSCSVQAWTRDWSPDHRTLDLTACHVTPSDAFAESRNLANLRRNHKYCAELLLPKLVNLFNANNNQSEEYGDPMIDNIEEKMLPGTKLNFDIYFKPKHQEASCAVSDASDNDCKKNHFYTCKASIWTRPSRNRQELELVNCAKIQHISLDQREPDPKSMLEDTKRKAVQLYNTKLAQKYEYGSVEIANLTFKTDFGIRTEFNLVLKPIDCQPNADDQVCQVDRSEIRVKCHVIMHQQPWHSEYETLRLTDCFQRFGANWEDGEGELTIEEQNSDEFKQMINRLSELHRPQSPIAYGVKKVQKAKFHILNGWRNITMELVFQPIDCNRSDEVAQQINCLDLTKQEMICDGLIAENEQSFGMKHLYLSYCRENWRPEGPRPVTQLEQDSHWFQDSVNSAWKLQNNMPNGTNLYMLVGIKEPTLETADDRKITYTMTLLETECVNNRDEEQFTNGKSESCPITENPTEKTCLVNYTLSRNNKYALNIRCHT